MSSQPHEPPTQEGQFPAQPVHPGVASEDKPTITDVLNLDNLIEMIEMLGVEDKYNTENVDKLLRNTLRGDTPPLLPVIIDVPAAAAGAAARAKTRSSRVMPVVF